MKKFLITLVILIVTVVIILNVVPEKKGNAYKNEANKSEENQNGTTINNINKLKSVLSNEKNAKDYVLTEVGVLYVSVIDDGTSRIGLAEYYCQLMKDESIKVDRVKIVRYGSQNDAKRDNAYGILLGESWCK